MAKYTNPVLPGFYPDPSVCRVGDDYYLVTSSFEYFPGVPVFHSRDLAHWRQIGHCLTRPEQLPLEHAPSSGGIYAPTIRHHDGRFYMVTTNVSNGGHFYVSTDDPAGSWSDPIWVPFSSEHGEGRSIDPSLFFDDDGKVYFTCNQSKIGIFQFEIDITTGEQLTASRLIWTGTGGQYPEAPHLYKINGMYYLLIAEGGTGYGHMVTIARSDQPYGPFESCPDNPILTHRSSDLPIQATGHADLIQTPAGDWWLVCLGIRPNPQNRSWPPYHHLGRETFLAPVTWTKTGWPQVGPVELAVEVESLPGESPVYDDEQTKDYHEDFAIPELALHWNFLRNPRSEDWSLDSHPGNLTLYGSELTLDDAGSPACVLRRQQHFRCLISTGTTFDPARDGEEAGLTVFMNENHHYDLALVRWNGQRCAIVRRRIGSLSAIVAQMPLPPGRVTLAVEADYLYYIFRCGLTGGEMHTLATGETRYLSTEVAGGFTGVYLGMYATGSGQRSSTPALFDYFEYHPYDS
ncbi:MAG: glycoside hydrolase family 43 protein [Anaerolineae bacterium]|nr:glycoside hydrolase family 43 protein [Anaerolineae bacterium]